MLAITTVVLNMTSYYEVIFLKELAISFTTSMDLKQIHPKIMGWGSLSVITIAVLVSIMSGILAYKECTCCHKMQSKFNENVKHGKSYLSKPFTTCHEEHEMNCLLRARVTPSVQIPCVDRELTHGIGDDDLEQQDDHYTDHNLEIGDDGITLTIDEVDGEIGTGYGDNQVEDQCSVDDEVFTGYGDNQLVDQISIDYELLHGCGDRGLMAELVKINSVLKLSDS